MKKKQVVGVLAGGFTGEDVISHRSAAMVMSHIDRELFEPWKLTWDRLGLRADTPDGQLKVDLNDFSFSSGRARIRPDIVFVMIHGDPGENGKIQGYLDLIGVPYTTGGVLPMSLTASKFFTVGFLQQHGITCAPSVLIRLGDSVLYEQLAMNPGLPAFVKPNNGGSSLATSKCEQLSDIEAAVAKAMLVDREVIIEAYLPGTEVTSGVILRDGFPLALPLTEIVTGNAFFDFAAKYEGASEEITPARLTESLTRVIQSLSEKVYALLGCCGMIRIDYIISEGIPYLIEVNSVPGFSEASIIPQQAAAIGIDKKELISLVLGSVTNKK